jgi:hypothetical protein
MFNYLDDIEKEVKNTIYGKYKYDIDTKTTLKNDYTDFTIIKNPEFPYELCNNYRGIDNIILNVSEQEQKNYYLLKEHSYSHGVWDLPTVDGKMLIFNNLVEIKKYCENVVNETIYLDMDEDIDRLYDIQLINIKFNGLKDYKQPINIELQEKIHCDNDDDEYNINFTIGNDFYVDFTVSKIENNRAEV